MSAELHSEVSNWWSNNPQTYGDLHGKPLFDGDRTALGDAAFYARADQAFIEWNRPLHGDAPFDRLFPYAEFKGKRVLEIGCGMGAMASLWARQGAEVSAVDLAPFSVKMTRQRFALLGLQGQIQEADGRALPFDDGAFDYVYSWGVLHHSPDLGQSLREMMRVLKPGGRFGLMLYHRHSLFYLWRIRYREGLVHGEREFLDPVALSSRYTDGSEAEGNPHTWPVTRPELRRLLGPFSDRLDFRVLGTEVDELFDSMLPGFGRLLPRWAIKPWARRLGWSLWTDGTRG
jgi:SAM-dependent methyltransferase